MGMELAVKEFAASLIKFEMMKTLKLWFLESIVLVEVPSPVRKFGEK